MASHQPLRRLEDYFQEGKIYILPQTYAILKARVPCVNAFANICNQKEITVVIDQKKIPKNNVIAIEEGWKIITFDLILPFELVGFLAKITTLLARAKISVFVLSSYSTDHILVKNKDLNHAVRVLRDLGFKIRK